MRIQKFIADCGVCSRRAAEDLVKNGEIFVNGKVAVTGQDINPDDDRVMYKNKRIHLKVCNKQYFIFYKPRGVITAMKAQDDRSVVADLIQGIKGRVYPIGRLDRDSEGLLILTDDGETAQKLTHPSSEIEKVYRVTVKGEASDKALNRLRQGVDIGDGETSAPAEVLIHSVSDGKTVLHFTLHEGKNREIRRMCEAVGLDVLLLKRISFGCVNLGHLMPGEYRPLSETEAKRLLESIGIPPETKIIKQRTPKKSLPAFNNKIKKSTKSIHEKRFFKQFGTKKK